MNRRGTYGRPQVGASWYQTPGAIQTEITDINADFNAFSREITNEVERRGYPVKPGSENDPIVKLFRDAWSPLIQGWGEFYANHKSWMSNFWWNSAPDAESWQRKLTDIRTQAHALGMSVLSQNPENYSASMLDPHHDIVDTAGDAAKKVADETWRMVKIAVYGALAVGGVFVLSSIASNLKAGKDPTTPYLALASRGRTPRMLPP